MPTPTALRTSILDAVVAAVTAADLPDLRGGVHLRTGKRAVAGQTFPCVEVSRAARPDAARRLTLHYDDSGYVVRVVFLANDPLGTDAAAPTYDLWHQTLSRLFREPETLRSRVTGVWGVEVRPLTPLAADDAAYSRAVGGLELVVLTWEPRG